MAFENISKGEFESIDSFVRVKGEMWSFISVKKKEDAEFISYCFNLQQRYDISKLEEAVKALEVIKNQFEKVEPLYFKDKVIISKIEQLLKQIKK